MANDTDGADPRLPSRWEGLELADDSDDVDSVDEAERLRGVLSQVVAHVANEALILARHEAVADDQMFPQLWRDQDRGEFDKRINGAVEHLGAPPEFYIVREDREEEIPLADNYPEAAMREVIAVFSRARRSVLRAHLYMTGADLLTRRPDIVIEPGQPEELGAALVSHAQAAFWEHAETAYIRLSSYWDRVGQVLDFAFFNIRKFDQQGFTAIMDRLHNNVRPMDARLARSEAWKRLHGFQHADPKHEDGLRWLLSRRNLIIHSLHLHPIKQEDEGVFRSQHNHLDVAHREKLRPRTPEGEAELLLGQLAKAAILFDDFLLVVQMSQSRKIDAIVG